MFVILGGWAFANLSSRQFYFDAFKFFVPVVWGQNYLCVFGISVLWFGGDLGTAACARYLYQVPGKTFPMGKIRTDVII